MNDRKDNPNFPFASQGDEEDCHQLDLEAEDERDMEDIAPPNREWHELYVRNCHKASALLMEVTLAAGMAQAEDLGDWVESMSTLMAFRPRTRYDIETKIRQELYPPTEGGEGTDLSMRCLRRELTLRLLR